MAPLLFAPDFYATKPQSHHLTIIIYLLVSLTLTLHSKVILQWYNFGYPWLITALHSLSCIIGMHILRITNRYTPKPLKSPQHRYLILAFSLLYTINIAISNVSLHHVSVPLHQVVRGTVPVFTVVLSKIALKRRYSSQVYASLVPVVVGVGVATYGDYGSTRVLGLVLTLAGTVLAAVKTVVTNGLLVGDLGLDLEPLDLLYHLSPLALAQTTLWGLFSGELGAALRTEYPSLTGLLVTLAVNGSVAFVLNIVSFTASRGTSALAMTVTGNVKVVLTVVLGCLLFGVSLSLISVVGVVVTLAGGIAYSAVRLRESKPAKNYV
ncbi:hypothetical protein LPJ66_003906 [Kickxella alabastrina]|uniref:Uncharacterized protein n=1 Tax=Kickxella alabastrina TaxID=61397 RepID=A0ACC1IMB6_9FUNG|nr:hypothetical protein LPJ66_003906 [Kickxella alabastrina]